MNATHHLRAIENIFKGKRYPVPAATFREALGVSKSTVDRLFKRLRDDYNWEIIYHREGEGGYTKTKGESVLNLQPDVYFSKDQLVGLAVMHELLLKAEPTLLAKPLAPIRKKLNALLASEKLGAKEIPQRIRIMRQSDRGAGKCFDAISHALLQRLRLKILFNPRNGGAEDWRIVSPQRLTLYRDNWYLDAWCHLRKELRRFGVDRITQTQTSTNAARNVSRKNLDAHFATAYGIFAGAPVANARLTFSPRLANWVANERWHASQVGITLPDGSYQLEVPYSNETELMMDILKYGAEVEVIAPESLRLKVIGALKAALEKYTNG